MGKDPSAIIIARHGARLDVADKQWHLTSPTPYDPPLSYGGWLQCRTLGARIISLLNSPLESENKTTSDSPSHEIQQDPQKLQGQTAAPKRKRRIIIHTSPYLRCLQTAIAVSAGIHQHGPDPDPHASAGSSQSNRCLLRVDACLGEWLTPGYFEEIIPPPNSDRMVVAAKAELLRRGEDILSSVDANSRSAAGYFPGGWGSSTTPGSPDSAVRTPTASAQNNRNRAASYDVSNTVTNPRAKGVLTKINTNLPNLARGGYVPPTPSYAISSSDPIPSGYVTHARDACTQIDYRWDSMRHPQNWGNGGEYGEEWSAMHTRFRQFLGNMVGWYRGHDRPSQSACNGESLRVGEDDDEEETVLVVITHGAGCNALIGALTGEPVFVDVGTASLTYAVSNTVESPPSDSLLRQYSLKLVASVDHLRPASNQSDQSALASPRTLISPPIPSYRHRVTSRSSLSQNSFVGRSATTGASAREWAMPRPSTTPRGSPGLWGQDGGTDSADEMVPNFEGPGLPAPLANGSADSPGESPAAEEPTQRTFSQPGLWGSAPSNQEREAGLNRRWTVTERRM